MWRVCQSFLYFLGALMIPFWRIQGAAITTPPPRERRGRGACRQCLRWFLPTFAVSSVAFLRKLVAFLWTIIVCNGPRLFGAWWTFGRTRLEFHFNSLRRVHGCALCAKLTLPDESYFTCMSCDDYDVCAGCCRGREELVSKTPGHTHRMCREVKLA